MNMKKYTLLLALLLVGVLQDTASSLPTCLSISPEQDE